MPSSEELALIEAANDLAALLETPRRSLRHRVHMKPLRKGHRAVAKVLASYFQRQKAAIVKHVRPLLQMVREDRADAKARAARIIPDTLSPLAFAVTGPETADYNEAIESAIASAARQIARELGTDATLPETFAGSYLREHSLSKLTGGLANATKERLRGAVADSFDQGGTADDIIAAIKAEMDGMSDKRASLIAQTEVNAAYNLGRAALAGEAGMKEKSWVTESGNPCPTCIGNEEQGWIPIGDLFSSGDEAPVAHTMCYCSLDFRTVSYHSNPSSLNASIIAE